MFSSSSQVIGDLPEIKGSGWKRGLSRPIACRRGKKAVEKYHSLTPRGWYN